MRKLKVKDLLKLNREQLNKIPNKRLYAVFEEYYTKPLRLWYIYFICGLIILCLSLIYVCLYRKEDFWNLLFCVGIFILTVGLAFWQLKKGYELEFILKRLKDTLDENTELKLLDKELKKQIKNL